MSKWNFTHWNNPGWIQNSSISYIQPINFSNSSCKILKKCFAQLFQGYENAYTIDLNTFFILRCCIRSQVYDNFLQLLTRYKGVDYSSKFHRPTSKSTSFFLEDQKRTVWALIHFIQNYALLQLFVRWERRQIERFSFPHYYLAQK